MLALAPMQDITDLPFWRLAMTCGGPDVFVTEFFRVHSCSRLDKSILKSIVENTTGRRVIAQLIGEDIPALVRTAQELHKHPVAGIDFNLGCPAPIVCRKSVGGGLLKNPERIHEILHALRENITLPFSVKTRLGYESPDEFGRLLDIYAAHNLDMVTVHGRTVRQMYRGHVHYEWIARAASLLRCPVVANGDIDSPAKALWVLKHAGAQGVMAGRGAVRNPWIFSQVREACAGRTPTLPTGREVAAYLQGLYEATGFPTLGTRLHLERLKKYLNFIAPGIDSEGRFLFRAQRLVSTEDFTALCRDFLDHDRPMAMSICPIPSESAAAMPPACCSA